MTAMRWEVTRDARRGCLKLLYTPLYIKVHVYICGDILVFTWHLPSLHSWREHQLRSTLGHGSTTRTRAFIDATPKQERSPEAHAHTHTTTLSDECVAPGPSGSAPPCPSPVSSGWLRRHSPYQNPPHTPLHHFSPPESACASGAGVATPTVCTPEWSGKCGRHGACVARSCGQKKCTCSPLTPPQCACP